MIVPTTGAALRRRHLRRAASPTPTRSASVRGVTRCSCPRRRWPSPGRRAASTSSAASPTMPAGSSSASRSGRPFWRPHRSPPTAGSIAVSGRRRIAVPAADLVEAPLDELAGRFAGEDSWAAYVLGPVALLAREERLAITGLRLLVSSSVPEGKGLGSSAAVEIAVAQATAGALGHPARAAPPGAARTSRGAARRARAVRIDGPDDGDVRRGGAHPGADAAGRPRSSAPSPCPRAHDLGDRLRRAARRPRRALPASALRHVHGEGPARRPTPTT